MASDRLDVIALISGGKDSFFSLLHCLHHGHRIVALANLFPRPGSSNDDEADEDVVQLVDPGDWAKPTSSGVASDRDLNSFMYQTVGHEVIPLYAAATGLPLYRQPISRNGAVRRERDYDFDDSAATRDETESMLSLLGSIVARHPEANALCAGAILSTYQRTRVESVALRLGLAPLAFLWQYPSLPPPAGSSDGLAADTQLLNDMAAAGLDARIIKVASAGLDESHLWERVSSEAGACRVRNALRKFGNAEGAAALGEGGEFETLVIDGPSRLFPKRICVPDDGRQVMQEGGGSSWLMLRGAHLEDKVGSEVQELALRTPDLLDTKFKAILDELCAEVWDEKYTGQDTPASTSTSSLLRVVKATSSDEADLLRWNIFAESSSAQRSIQEETTQIMNKVQELLDSNSVDAAHITNTIIVLRRMSDFPLVNAEYGKLFVKANPPSRVTISCGGLLPDGRNIAVYCTVPSSLSNGDRNGLHVQSRSYWAPANIGPYSQAIDTSITANGEPTGLRSVIIAGQVPLVPSNMLLPSPAEKSHELQIVLSLQHLWRVALEMKVKYWTSAVAYFARCPSAKEMERSAKIASFVWRRIHSAPEEDDDEDGGPDPWDLKYNPQYMSLSGQGGESQARLLPDWSVLTLRQQNEPESCVPPVFAVEVEELPRQAAVEWHGHVGLSRVDESSIEIMYHPNITAGWSAWHVIVQGDHAVLAYTTLASVLDKSNEDTAQKGLIESMKTAYETSLSKLLPNNLQVSGQKPYLMYVYAVKVRQSWASLDRPSDAALIPCRSIWAPNGQQLTTLALYKLNLS